MLPVTAPGNTLWKYYSINLWLFLHFLHVWKIDDRLALLDCILYRLPRTAFFVLNVTDNQIGPVNHFAVTNLDSRLWVCHRCGVRDFYIGVIVVEVIFVIKILSRGIWQHQNKGAVIVPMIFSYAKYWGRHTLIKIPIASHQKIHILIFVNKFPYLLFQKVLYLYDVIHISVTKKRHRINPHISLLIKTPTEPF